MKQQRLLGEIRQAIAIKKLLKRNQEMAFLKKMETPSKTENDAMTFQNTTPKSDNNEK